MLQSAINTVLYLFVYSKEEIHSLIYKYIKQINYPNFMFAQALNVFPFHELATSNRYLSRFMLTRWEDASLTLGGLRSPPGRGGPRRGFAAAIWSVKRDGTDQLERFLTFRGNFLSSVVLKISNKL